MRMCDACGKPLKAGNYLLRDIPAELWTAAKHRAVDEGLNLRGLILKALQEYLMKNTP